MFRPVLCPQSVATLGLSFVCLDAGCILLPCLGVCLLFVPTTLALYSVKLALIRPPLRFSYPSLLAPYLGRLSGYPLQLLALLGLRGFRFYPCRVCLLGVSFVTIFAYMFRRKGSQDILFARNLRYLCALHGFTKVNTFREALAFRSGFWFRLEALQPIFSGSSYPVTLDAVEACAVYFGLTSRVLLFEDLTVSRSSFV